MTHFLQHIARKEKKKRDGEWPWIQRPKRKEIHKEYKQVSANEQKKTTMTEVCQSDTGATEEVPNGQNCNKLNKIK